MAMMPPVLCGRCAARLDPVPRDALLVFRESGNLVVTSEGGLHRCPTLTKEDEAAALTEAGKFYRWRR